VNIHTQSTNNTGDCRLAEFLNRFLEDYLVCQFAIGGTEPGKNSYARLSFATVRALSAWQLGQKKGTPKSSCQWELETEVLASTEGTYRWRQLRPEAGRCTGLVSHEQ
jgi:hypothetical protein